MQSLQDDLNKVQSGKREAEERVQALEAQLSEECEKTRQANAICTSFQESLSLKETECAGLGKSEAALEVANKHVQQLEGMLAQVKRDQAEQQVRNFDVFRCMQIVYTMAGKGSLGVNLSMWTLCCVFEVCGTHCRACGSESWLSEERQHVHSMLLTEPAQRAADNAPSAPTP